MPRKPAKGKKSAKTRKKKFVRIETTRATATSSVPFTALDDPNCERQHIQMLKVTSVPMGSPDCQVTEIRTFIGRMVELPRVTDVGSARKSGK